MYVLKKLKEIKIPINIVILISLKIHTIAHRIKFKIYWI